MLTRIVKMHFELKKVPDFLEIFEEVKAKIIGFEGCTQLYLYQDQQQPEVIFTYSIWTDATALDAYRHSPLFQGTWKRTKALFAEKPMAWSLDLVEKLEM